MFGKDYPRRGSIVILYSLLSMVEANIRVRLIYRRYRCNVNEIPEHYFLQNVTFQKCDILVCISWGLGLCCERKKESMRWKSISIHFPKLDFSFTSFLFFFFFFVNEKRILKKIHLKKKRKKKNRAKYAICNDGLAKIEAKLTHRYHRTFHRGTELPVFACSLRL